MKLSMPRKYLWIAASILLLAVGGFAVTTSVSDREVSVPNGTELRVRLSESIATNRDAPGEPFKAVMAEPVTVEGETVIPKGAPVTGRIVSIRESGRLSGVARVQLTLTSVEVNGKEYEIHTTDFGQRGGNHRKRNWAFIGGGAGGGTAIGAIAAGGKGAAIGGPIGAGAGIAVATLTGKKDFVIPAETVLKFELAGPVMVEVES